MVFSDVQISCVKIFETGYICRYFSSGISLFTYIDSMGFQRCERNFRKEGW